MKTTARLEIVNCSSAVVINVLILDKYLRVYGNKINSGVRVRAGVFLTHNS